MHVSGAWKSRWAQRVMKLAGIGIKPVERPMLGMPVLTEVALGRATDHLYHALPKSARRELAAIPETVRRLEGDASRLRDSIAAFDDQLAAFERGGDALEDSGRATMHTQLRESRALSAQKLSATVVAIENIRLDLLRLQMGSAGIESVTASLEAAQRVGEQIAFAADAQSEVELLLKPVRIARPDADAFELRHDESDDDADTPVSGVPATRG